MPQAKFPLGEEAQELQRAFAVLDLHGPKSPRYRKALGVIKDKLSQYCDHLEQQKPPAGDASAPLFNLDDLVRIFGRSKGTLYHWYRVFNLRKYSVSRKGGYKFSKQSLRAFLKDLQAQRRLPEAEQKVILERIEEGSPQSDKSIRHLVAQIEYHGRLIDRLVAEIFRRCTTPLQEAYLRSFYLEGLTTREIAGKFRTAPGNVHAHIQRGLESIMKTLEMRGLPLNGTHLGRVLLSRLHSIRSPGGGRHGEEDK